MTAAVSAAWDPTPGRIQDPRRSAAAKATAATSSAVSFCSMNPQSNVVRIGTRTNAASGTNTAATTDCELPR